MSESPTTQEAEPEEAAAHLNERPATIRVRNRGKVFHFFWPFTRYVVTSISAFVARIFFDLFNRTVFIGLENVGEAPNTVLLPNHQSMIDGFLVGSAALFPKSLIKPSVAPWLPAASENFFANPILRWFADNWKCIPVKPGRKDFGAMKRMEACLKVGILIVFPEGTRSRDGELLPPRSGIGFVMCRANPRSVPVCMNGMDRILPVGKFWPRIGQTIYLHFGEPVDISEFHTRLPSREQAQASISKVFNRVAHMKGVLERYRRYRGHVLKNKPWFYRIYAV